MLPIPVHIDYQESYTSILQKFMHFSLPDMPQAFAMGAVWKLRLSDMVSNIIELFYMNQTENRINTVTYMTFLNMGFCS